MFERIHLYGNEIAAMFSEIDTFFPGREIVILDDEEQFAEAIPEIEVLLGFRVPRDHWGRAEALRVIQIPGAGVDSILPAPELPESVQVCNASGCHEPEMPEFVIAALFHLIYRFPTLTDRQRSHTWRLVRPTRPLTDRRLCIVGLGTIGQSVAARAAALGMRVVGVRNSGAAVDGVDLVVPPERRHEVLTGADAVVVITPLTDDTRGLIGSDELASLAEGAVLVDVSRGGVVDLDALVAALDDGPVESALVDVFETEPLPADSPLWDVPNLSITPHTAGWSRDYAGRILELMAANLEAVEAGRRPPSLVDRAQGY